MHKQAKNIKNLDDFQGWEQPADNDDFFSTIDSANNQVDSNSTVEKNKEEEKDNDSKKEDNDSENLFTHNEEEIENDEKKDSQISEKTSDNILVANFLKEKGILDFELKEEEELTNDTAEQLLEDFDDNFEVAINNKVEELFEEMPDVVKQLNKYVIKGGDISNFLKSINNITNSSITEDIDLSKESNQELIVKEMLKEEDNDDEFIETQLDFLKDSGKLEMFAEKKFNKWKKNKKNQQTELLKQQEENNKRQKEAIKSSKQKISSYLSENDEIGGLKFSRNDKKLLPSYMNDRTIKLQNGSVINQLQKELFYDLPQNDEAFVQLAILMKNRNKDGTFNFDSIVKNAETKVVKKVKENVRRNKTSIPAKSKDNRQRIKQSLADFFD